MYSNVFIRAIVRLLFLVCNLFLWSANTYGQDAAVLDTAAPDNGTTALKAEATKKNVLEALVDVTPENEASTPAEQTVVQALLISSVRSIQPGTPFWVGILLRMPPGWHIYWQHPGELGLATTIDWELPADFIVHPGLWPTPLLLEEDGGMISYAYFNEAPILFQITPPSDLPEGKNIALEVNTKWLECKNMCRPGEAKLVLHLPVNKDAPVVDAEGNYILEKSRDRGPQPIPSDWMVQAVHHGKNEIVLKVVGSAASLISPKIEKVYFYPFDDSILPSAQQTFSREGNQITLRMEGNPTSSENPKQIKKLSGLLYTPSEWIEGSRIDSIVIDREILESKSADAKKSNPEPKPFGVLLLMAFLGGLILNAMPCIFPVIGIKILGFVNQSGASRSTIRLHGLVFSAGIIFSFWVLTLTLMLMRASGEHVGWGFQLQNPQFVYALAALCGLLGLNLTGAFEINARFLSIGSSATHQIGLLGSFLSGVLTTTLATPCSAPVLASALGAALLLDAIPALILFTFMGLGLCTPYLLLSLFPTLVQWLPKPGPWMQSFRQFMGFFLYATCIYLLWILAAQIKEQPFLYVLLSLVFIRIAAWSYNQGQTSTTPSKQRLFAILGTSILIFGLVFGFPREHKDPLKWEPWSAERVRELKAQNRIIYVNFTARWCATCQTNERSYLDKQVIDRFKELDIALLKADWTNKDPRITAALAEFERSAVPLDVLYAPQLPQPTVLPNILLPYILLEALDGLKKEKDEGK